MKDSTLKYLSRFKILPLLVVVATLAFGVRFTEFVTGVSNAPGTANAQIEPAADTETPAEAAPQIDDKMEDKTGDKMDAAPNPNGLAPPPNVSTESTDWRDADESDLEFSTIRVEMFEDLKKRRKQLDERERELSVRDALLKTAEKELNQKYDELVSIRSEIQELLKEQSSEEQARVASLVKIYEGMKPKDAARIFNTLDLDILLSVVSQMSERKSAPIIAAMSPERARRLTTMLMEQKTLGEISTDL